MGADLRVEGPDIIVHDPRRLVDELLVEQCAGEVSLTTARVRVQRSIGRDAHAGPDLLGRGSDDASGSETSRLPNWSSGP